MKFLFDLFPLVLFFAAYKTKGIYPATGVLIAATGLQVLWLWVMKRRVEKMYLITFISVLLLGGLTLALHDDRFLKAKPTIVNVVFAIALAVGHFVGKQVIIQRMMGQFFNLTDTGWRRLDWAWAVFFLFCAGLNEYVARCFSQDIWVKFKVFGLMALSMVFMLAQVVVLRKHLADPPPESDEKAAG